MSSRPGKKILISEQFNKKMRGKKISNRTCVNGMWVKGEKEIETKKALH